jgi:nitrogen fixation protein NifU and related proteins
MSSDLQDLYQEVIFDHNRNPRHFGKVEDANRCARGFNPLCGDKMTLYLKVDDDDFITDVSFEGSGCAISVASASMMTDVLVGKTVQEAEAMFEKFHGMMMKDNDNGEQLGKLRALSGVKGFPSRIKCATLAWHALQAALKDQNEPVSTE